MKKIISILLSCIMLMSIFTASAAQVMAVDTISSYFTVTDGGFNNDEITYTVSINPTHKALSGVIIYAEFDSAMLEVSEANVSGKFTGVVVDGTLGDNSDMYSVAWTDANGVNITSSAVEFMTITFRMIGTERDYESVKFYCVEFYTDDGNDANDQNNDPANKVLVAEDTFFTLSAPTVDRVYSTVNDIVVEWSSVEDATAYNVYRKATGSDWTLIKEASAETRYIDTTITTGIAYDYAVSALNENGESDKSDAVEGFNFGSIDSIEAYAISNGIQVVWGEIQVADSYKVYRKEASQDDTQWELIGSTGKGVVSYKDTTAESYVEYNYRVEAVKGNYVAGMSVAYPTVKYLAIPEFAVTSTEKGIEIYYGAVNGATKYVIEKKTGNGAWTTLLTVNNPTEDVYLDENIVVNGSYSYRIQAFAADIESEVKTSVVITRLGTPTVTGITSVIEGIKINWSAVSGATEYKIYRKLHGTNQLTVIGTAVGTSYTDTTAQSGVVYTYTVSAANATGCGMYDAAGKTRLFLASPDMVSRENVVNGVKITWEHVEGATGYRLYRRGAGAKYWSYLGTFSASKNYYVDYGKDANGKNIGMVNGDYYRYTVRATNENRGSSVTYSGGYNSTVYSDFDPTGMYLKHVSTPKMISVSNATKGLLVKWSAVKGATSYRVYRRGAGSTYWTYLGNFTGTSYTDTAVAKSSGNYYRYTVRAVSGYFSGFDANGLYLIRLADPVLSSARSYSSGITVKWKQVAGATGYYVYRKTSGSSWSRIATLSGNSSVSFTDKNARKGTTYIYTVKAFRGRVMSNCDMGGISCRAKY